MNDAPSAPHDASRIDLSNGEDVVYWATRFGVSPERLRRCVVDCGDMLQDVEQALGRSLWSRRSPEDSP